MKRCQEDINKIEELKKSYEVMSNDMSVSEEKLKSIKKEIKTLKAQRKYSLVKDGDLFQVVSKLDFDDIKAGYIGGHVSGENNLSHKGNCWIYKGARAIDNARVMGNAKVKDNAVISGDAMIFDNALVQDDAIVTEDAMVYKNAVVKGNSTIKGNSHVRGKSLVSGKSVLSGQIIVSGKLELTDQNVCGQNMKRIKKTTFK